MEKDYRDEVAKGRRGIIDWLMKYIPGYRGYAEKETRREADKLLRQALADKLKAGQHRVEETRDRFAAAAQIDRLDDIDRVGLIFENVIDRLGFASYGYAGFFDTVRVDEAALDRLYAYDEGLAQAIDVINGKADALAAAAAAGEDISVKLDELKSELKAFERKLDDRQNAILGVA